MTRQLTAYAKSRGESIERIGHPRTLGQLFPPDNPHSPAMWRLAIIRDDLDFEIDGVALPGDADDDRIWDHIYCFRRMSVSIMEAKNLICHDVPALLRDRPRGAAFQSLLQERVRAVAALLDAIEGVLDPIRDAFGGHVRPNNANPNKASGDSYDVAGLRAHASWPGAIHLNRSSAIGTSYREFTKISLLFAWPEVTDDATLKAKLDGFSSNVLDVTVQLLAAIDSVLFMFWVDVGAMEMPVLLDGA